MTYPVGLWGSQGGPLGWFSPTPTNLTFHNKDLLEGPANVVTFFLQDGAITSETLPKDVSDQIIDNVSALDTLYASTREAYSIIRRLIKGSQLTWTEFDNNFLNFDKWKRDFFYSNSQIAGTSTLFMSPYNSIIYLSFSAPGNPTLGATNGGPAKDGTIRMFIIKEGGTSRTLIWDSSARAIGVTLPTTTVINKHTYVTFIWNASVSKWDCVDVSQEP